MNREGESREQLEDCAFWEVTNERGAVRREPVDEHAVYGRTTACGPDALTEGVPVRNALSDLLTAIRCLGSRHDLKNNPDDRVRVNGGSWMEVVQPGGELGWVDEGFLCRYEDGSAVYGVKAHDTGVNAGTESGPRMRNWETHRSVGVVSCVEVDWA